MDRTLLQDVAVAVALAALIALVIVFSGRPEEFVYVGF